MSESPSHHLAEPVSALAKARVLAYQLYGDLGWHSTEDDFPVTDELVNWIGYRVRREVPEAVVSNAMVHEWLTDERKWSPWVDLVAVRRAAGLDPDVIANLTNAERAVTGDLMLTQGWYRSHGEGELDRARPPAELEHLWAAMPPEVVAIVYAMVSAAESRGQRRRAAA